MSTIEIHSYPVSLLQTPRTSSSQSPLAFLSSSRFCCKLQHFPAKMLSVSHGICSVTPAAMLEIRRSSNIRMSYAEQDQKCTSQCISVAFRSPQQSMVRVQNSAAETDIEESWTWRRHQLRLQITDLRREQRSFRVRLEEQSLARDQVQGELAETLAAIADNLKEQLLLARNETLDSTITTSLQYDSEEDDTCNATSDQIASKGVADLAAQRLGDERRSVGAKVGQQHEHQVFNDLSTRTSTSAGITNTHASVSAPESRHQDDNLVAIHENPKESITSEAELGVSTMRLLKKLDVHDYVHGALRTSHMRSWLQSRKIEEDPS